MELTGKILLILIVKTFLFLFVFFPVAHLESLLITLIRAAFSSFSLWLSALRSPSTWKEKRKKIVCIAKLDCSNVYFTLRMKHCNSLYAIMLVYSTKRNKMEPIKTVPVSAAVKYNQNLRLLLISIHYILKKTTPHKSSQLVRNRVTMMQLIYWFLQANKVHIARDQWILKLRAAWAPSCWIVTWLYMSC